MELTFIGTGAADFGLLDDPDAVAEHVRAARWMGGRNRRRPASVVVTSTAAESASAGPGGGATDAVGAVGAESTSAGPTLAATDAAGEDAVTSAEAEVTSMVKAILIDHHDGAGLAACGLHARDIGALLVTHGHWDHLQPRAVLELASQRPDPLPVFGNASVCASLRLAANHTWDAASNRLVTRPERMNDSHRMPVHCRELVPGQSVEVGGTTVTALAANHQIDTQRLLMEQQALIYLLRANSGTLLYALDSSYLLPETLQALSGVYLDAVVLDGTFGEMEIDPATSGHHNFRMLDQTVAELRAAGCVDEHTTVFASHISLAYVPPHDVIGERLRRRGVVLAHDGMVWTRRRGQSR